VKDKYSDVIGLDEMDKLLDRVDVRLQENYGLADVSDVVVDPARGFIERVPPMEKVVRTPVQQPQNVDQPTSPTVPAESAARSGAGEWEHPTYHPMGKLVPMEPRKAEHEKLPVEYRSAPIIFSSKIERYFDEKAIWIGKPIMAILCEDGMWNLSDEEASMAFARVTEDELNQLRYKPAEEATQTGADFRKE
jgi:hypothetical protein